MDGRGIAVGGYALGSTNQAPSRQQFVSDRGADVMPFDQGAATHTDTANDNANGGAETVRANNPGDTAQIELVRGHLRQIAAAFAAGDFSDPPQSTRPICPALPHLSASASKLSIVYGDVYAGGRITYSSVDPTLVAALHDWFAAQASDHRMSNGPRHLGLRPDRPSIGTPPSLPRPEESRAAARTPAKAGRLWKLASTLTHPTTATTEYSRRCSVPAVETLTHGQVLARFGHALSDPTRARLLLALQEAPGYPAQLADLLGVTRQNLSNHLACLRGCGLVVTVPEGRRARYELADPRLGHALSDLLELVLVTDPSVCPSAPADDCC